MIPFEKTAAFFESAALLETGTPLAAAGVFQSLLGTCDTVSMLRQRLGNLPFGGTTQVTDYDPIGPDPRYFVDYVIWAQSAVGPYCPGTLTLLGGTAAPGSPGLSTGLTFARIPFHGGGLQLSADGAAGVVYGTVRVPSRAITVIYHNGAVAQLDFSLGVYLRTIGK